MAWLVTLLVAAMVLPAAGPAVAQVTVPGPDFNNDGFGDLAVGVPAEDVGAVADAGAVNVRYAPGFGQPFGLTLLTQDRPETADRFGSALAEGFLAEFDGTVDLAVGAPGEDVGAIAGAGALNVLYGLDGVGTELLTQADAAGTVEPGDAFGAALSEPFFHEEDVLGDLGVGAPGETVNGRAAAGAGSVLFGDAADGLGGGGGSQFFFQGVSGLGGAAESADGFGAAFS